MVILGSDQYDTAGWEDGSLRIAERVANCPGMLGDWTVPLRIHT
jgi:hypothetical protein